MVQHAFFVSLSVGNCIKHLHRPQVQRSLCDFIGILAVRAVGDARRHVVIVGVLVLDVPRRRDGRIMYLDAVTDIVGGA